MTLFNRVSRYKIVIPGTPILKIGDLIYVIDILIIHLLPIHWTDHACVVVPGSTIAKKLNFYV